MEQFLLLDVKRLETVLIMVKHNALLILKGEPVFGMTQLNAELRHVKLHLIQKVMIAMMNANYIWMMVHVQLHQIIWVVLLDLTNVKE